MTHLLYSHVFCQVSKCHIYGSFEDLQTTITQVGKDNFKLYRLTAISKLKRNTKKQCTPGLGFILQNMCINMVIGMDYS